MEKFEKQCIQALQALSIDVGTSLEIPADRSHGDFAFACFRLAKQEKSSPHTQALRLASSLVLPPSIHAHALGPYLNFQIEKKTLFETILGSILTTAYGSLPPKTRGTWIIEYSSPNVAKPLNIYHLRPTVLGAALDRIGRLRGYDVISLNHLGDWGKQYGLLTVGFQIYPMPENPTIHDLVALYVQVNQDAVTDPTIQERARQAFCDLEAGDPQITALWQKCVTLSCASFEAMYARLGVHFDYIWGESFYTPMIPSLVELLKAKSLLKESDGAWVVPVTDTTGKELPPCMIQKSDGATIYATRDLAAALYRYERFHFDRMTYIVGAEQKLHFIQIFDVLKQLELPFAKHCEHIPFGLYRFQDSKMSTRRGNFITLEEVLEAAQQRVYEILQSRQEARDDDAEVAEMVAIGAVIFHDLAVDPIKDIDFALERAIDFEGETGPYLQYAHTRCLGILKKAQFVPTFDPSYASYLGTDEEHALIRHLGLYPRTLERTLTTAKASILAHYLLDVTHAFHVFYKHCHVLTDNKELSYARLLLVEATRKVLAQGLSLLGIPLPHRM